MESGKNTTRENSEFRLTKWFLDCITDEGEAVIFYAAKLDWLGWEIPYSSCLSYAPDKGTDYRFSFQPNQLPVREDTSIRWSDHHFGVEGIWQSKSAPISERLYESNEGFLEWNCFQAAGNAHLQINDREVSGKGYVEKMVLTIEPWKLPIDELRWGRFSSQENPAVWIEWSGDQPRSLLWFRGKRLENPIIEDSRVTVAEQNLLLEMDQGVVLESEEKIMQVVGNIISHFPGISHSIPTRFLKAEEIKWLSHGTLHILGEPNCNGWIIHELVQFKPQLE